MIRLRMLELNTGKGRQGKCIVAQLLLLTESQSANKNRHIDDVKYEVCDDEMMTSNMR